MSIFASLEAPDEDEHEDSCAIWDKKGGVWSLSDRPCDCGQPRAPLVYQGSHILPSEDDPRGGRVDLAMIPPHVRYYRENPDATPDTEPESPPEPFLRFGVNDCTVILTRQQVETIHSELSWWLAETERGKA